GHEWTATFTVNAGAVADDVVWVPSTADGPLQPLTEPGNNQGTTLAIGQRGTTYPVYLNDATGAVTSVGFAVNYNPAVLNVAGAVSSLSAAGSTFAMISNNPTTGVATFSYTGPSSASAGLTGGQVPLGFIQATVPNSSPTKPIYKGKEILHLSG